MPAISTPFAVDGEREYWEVMAVMDHRFINETEIIYNVKWKLRLGEVPSWPDSENWVQESEMKCPELLEQYWLEFRKKLKPFFRKDYTRREAFDLYLARKMRQWSCSLSKQDLEVCTGLPTINHGVEKTDLVEQVITVPAFLLGPITIKINSNESPEPPEIIEILDSDDEIPLKPSNEEAKKCKVEIKSSLEINGSSIKNDQDFSKKMNILKNYASDFLGREFNPDNLQKKSESMFSISKPGVNKEKNNENESLSHAKANCGYESIDDYEVEEMEDAQCIVDSRKKLSSRNLPSFYTVKRKITPEDKEDSTHAPINKKKINASSNLSLSASKSNISSNSLSPILRPNNSINKISKSPSNIINQSVTIDSKSEKLYTQLLIKKFEEAKEGKSQALQRGYEAIDVLYILRESISGKMFCLTFFMNPENDIESFFVPIDDAIAMFPLLVNRCLARWKDPKVCISSS